MKHPAVNSKATNLIILRIPVGAVHEQHIPGVHIIDSRRPMQRRLAAVIGSVYIRIGIYKIFDHAFDGEPGSEDKGGGSIVHPRVQVGRSVAEEDLEGAHCIRCHSGV